MQTGNILLDKSFQFALDIIKFTSILEDKKKFVIANQLMRCGTSIGANVHEAQYAQSKNDFISKLEILVTSVQICRKLSFSRRDIGEFARHQENHK